MHFSEQDLAKQNQEIARLSEELARLDKQLEEQEEAARKLEAAGLSLDDVALTPELKAAMDASLQQAAKAGRDAADALRTSLQPESTATGPSACRSRGLRV